MDERYIKLLEKQNRVMRFIAALLVLILVFVIGAAAVFIPKLNKTINETSAAVTKMNAVVAEIEEADIAGLVSDTSNLVDQSNKTVADAAEKIDSIDIETLNNAIANLNAVVEPLSKLFGR